MYEAVRAILIQTTRASLYWDESQGGCLRDRKGYGDIQEEWGSGLKDIISPTIGDIPGGLAGYIGMLTPNP